MNRRVYNNFVEIKNIQLKFPFGYYNKKYEKYKQKIAVTRGTNKLYIFWVNSKGFECKAVGPYSMCFCNHRLNTHDLDNSITNKKVKCKDSRCKCKKFDYVPDLPGLQKLAISDNQIKDNQIKFNGGETHYGED